MCTSNDLMETMYSQNHRMYQFIGAYIKCALWSTSCNRTDDDDQPMDDAGYTVESLAEETMLTVIADCQSFWADHHAHWKDDSQAGHDFWLTRNGHGTGFWDRQYPASVLHVLESSCRNFGEVWWIIGDDDLIYC